MNKNAQSYSERRRGRRILGVILAIMTLLMVFAVFNASAADDPSLTMTLSGDLPWGSTTYNNYFSTDDVVAFGADNIFIVNTTQSVKFLRVTAPVSSTSAMQLKASGDKWQKPAKQVNGKTTWEYTSYSALSAAEIQSMFNLLRVEFVSTGSLKSGDVTISVEYGSNSSRTTTYRYKSRIYFYQFAKGDYDNTSLSIGYTADGNKANENKLTFADDSVKQGGRNTAATPRYDSEGLNAYFRIRINNNFGAPRSRVDVGYQVKRTSETWQNAPIIYTDSLVKPQSGRWNWSEQDRLREISVSKMNSDNEPLQAGVEYDVRGVIGTDSSSSVNYTESFKVRYDKPVINMFNMGSLTEPIDGGTSRNYSLTGVFNNTNNDNRRISYTNYNGVPVIATGATLEISTYFTDNFDATVYEGGIGIDNSEWRSVGTTRTWRAQNTSDASEFNRNINQSESIAFERIDSRKSAMKVVIKDVATGYSTFYITDCFTIDSNKPTLPQISAYDAEGHEMNFEEQDWTVGGADAQVNLAIHGSTDLGSGLKEYNYSTYYVSTEDANNYLARANSTTKDILNIINGYTENNFGYATYTTWSSLNPDIQGMARFSVNKDGYYKIEARALDNAGKISTVAVATFRVDLSSPPTPSARMVKNTNSNDRNSPVFAPYDNRTYSSSEVWLLIYEQPMTGKIYESYQISNDNGLSWIDVDLGSPPGTDLDETAPTYTNDDMVVLGAGSTGVYYTVGVTDGNGNVHQAYSDNDLENFSYQKAVRIPTDTAKAMTGYQSIIVRVVDKFGNTSLVSEPTLMRTSDNIEVIDTLKHESIEVALAMGATTKSADGVTPLLKSAAARKINERYYGTAGQRTDPNGENFNPWLYFQNANGTWHDCRWDQTKDPNCLGECLDGANCPYAKYGDAYEFYRPQQVNIQGLSNMNAAMRTDWAEYDHNTTTNGSLTGLRGTYDAAVYDLTSASEGRVRGGTTGNTSNESGKGNVNASPVYQVVLYSTSPTQTGCMYRARHFIDYTTESGGVTKDTPPFSKMLAMGYSVGPYRDWKFLEDDQPGKKTLQLTIDETGAAMHTYDGGGFFFNTTIRKNASGTWIISGYAFFNGIYNDGTLVTDPWGVKGWYKSMILKFQEVNLIQFADGNITASSSEAAGGMNGMALRSANGITVVSSINYPDTASLVGGKIKNFKIVSNGGKTSVLWTMGAGNETDEAFAAIEEWERVQEANQAVPGTQVTVPTNTTFTTVKGTTIRGGKLFDDVNTPRVTVNGADPGANSYGFGPMVGYLSHGCARETRVEFSNIKMIMQVVRRLSEVVTEPQWGGGKAKFITYISDESAEDFQDAALSSAIQWRLFNDKAKFVGWGKDGNKQTTIDFLGRIDGEGFYEPNDVAQHNTDTLNIDSIAEYITTAYYKEFGFTDDETNGNKPIVDVVQGKAQQHGAVYTIDDVISHEFAVSPEQYNTSTANEDFPSGRWFITHDTTGYSGAMQSPRHYKYSDALELKVTEPGRWTVYFAPDPEKVANYTLDPEDAVFDFVVSQRPVANFTGNVVGNIVNIDDSLAIDLDAYDGASLTPMAREYYDERGIQFNSFPNATAFGNVANTDIQLSGIQTLEWKWDLLRTVTVDGKSTLERIYTEDDWIAAPLGDDPLSGKDIFTLTDGAASTLSDNDILTVYLRVTDTSTVKKAAYDATGQFLGYYFEAGDSLVSDVVQQNVTAGATITYSPLSSFQLSKVYMYDTAEEDTENAKITVTRRSTHPQNKTFKLTWKVNFTEDKNKYIPLVKRANGDYYLDAYVSEDGTYTHAAYTAGPVLKQLTAPDDTGNGTSKGGVWEISKKFIADNIGATGNNMVLQINEATMGLTADDWRNGVTVEHDIVDSSARAVFYMADITAPSAHNVTVTTKLWKGAPGKQDPSAPGYFDAANWMDAPYEASNYLDVTQGDKYVEIAVADAKDAEGRLGGYSYYFYQKLPNGSAGAYYKYDEATGKKTQVSNLEQARNDIIYSAQDASDNKPLVLRLTSAVMGELSSEAVSIAIQAFDTQNPTNRNKESKLEDIKFSKSIPVAPGILVTDTENKRVAEIKNDNGLEGQNPALDVADSDKDWYSRTTVTVEFKPKSGKFTLDTTTNELIPDPNSKNEYYLDITGAADRTSSMTNIIYKLEQNMGTAASSNWVTIRAGTAKPTDKLEVSGSGEYRITAVVQNGSKAESDSREVTFKIDVGKPTAPTVSFKALDRNGIEIIDAKLDDFQQSYAISLSGASDIEDTQHSKYKYSLNGGADWFDTDENLNLPKTIDLSGLPTGRHEIRIATVDPAGNESSTIIQTIMIDKTPPHVPPAVVSSDSETVYTYDELMVRTVINGKGTAWPMDRNGTYTDTVVPFPATEDKDTKVITAAINGLWYNLVPDEGYELASVMFGGTTYKVGETAVSIMRPTENGAYNFWPPRVELNVADNKQFEADITVTYVLKPALRKAAEIRLAQAAGEDAVELYEPRVRPETQNPDGTYTIRVEWDGGRSTLMSPPTINIASGEPYSISIEAFTGSVLSRMLINGLHVDIENDEHLRHEGREYTYDFDAVTEAMDIEFYFADRPYRELYLDVTGREGTLELDSSTLNNVDVMKTKVPNKNGAYEVYEGAEITLIATPEEEYALRAFEIDGNKMLDGADVTEPRSFMYTVPKYNASEGESNEIHVKADFGIAPNTPKTGILFAYGMPENPIEDIEIGGSGDEVDLGEPVIGGSIWPAPETNNAGQMIIYVPTMSTQNFTVTVLPGYTFTKYEYTQTEFGQLNKQEGSPDMDLGTRKASFVLTDIMGNEEGTDTSLVLFFEKNTYSVTENHAVEQGLVVPKVFDKDGVEIENPDFGAIPEGASIEYSIEAKDGNRLSNIRITKTTKDTTSSTYIGAQLKFRIESITANYTINVEFERRGYLHDPEVKHRIVVTANNVLDAESGLTKTPYSYAVYEDGTTASYTLATGSNEYVALDNLKPNRKYLVQVRAEDNVGNRGVTSSPAVIYTKANQPHAYAAELVDGEAGSLNKNVRLYVENNGNPANTEYLIRYSEYPTMDRGVQSALTSDGQEDWKTLTPVSAKEGYIDISGLISGKPYYLTVDARNNAEEPVITGGSYAAEDIQYIVLSHPAPELASLYFEEQENPRAPVILKWDSPPSDVKQVVIYKDGSLLTTCVRDITQYKDETTMLGGAAIGNMVSTYSYAYENEAGVGAQRAAVSALYREAYLAGTVEAPSTKMLELRSLINNSDRPEDQRMFEQTLIYPNYPKAVERVTANRMSTDESNYYAGQIKLRVVPDTISTSRTQKYKLRLIAGNIVDGEFVEDTAYNQSNSEMLVQETSTQTNTEGAVAEWSGLYTECVYRVQVIEVMTSGPRFSSGVATYAIDGSQYGIEGTLGKQFIVDEEGYRVNFVRSAPQGLDTAQILYGATRSWSWTDNEGGLYANPSDPELGWDKTMDLVDLSGLGITDDIIKFNTRPQVALPSESENYFDKLNPSYIDEDGGYILIDKSRPSPTFTVNIAAWDKDSPRLTIEGEIEGYKASSGILEPPPEVKPNKLEEYFQLNFAGANLKSGVYKTIGVSANDSELVTRVTLGAEGGLKIVVNQVTPSITIAGGAQSRKIQLGSDFKDLNFSASAAINSGSNASERSKIRELRMEILKDRFIETYGSYDYATVKAEIIRRGEAATDAAADTVIDSFNPSVTYMVQITEDIYNNPTFAANRDKYFRQELVTLGSISETLYWAEFDFALEKGICSWLTKNGDQYEVTGNVGKSYSLRVYSKFGNNEAQVTTSFAVEKEPSLTVPTNPGWKWVTTEFVDEYNYYEGNTIAFIAGNLYKGEYDAFLPDEYLDESGYSQLAESSAARIGENGKMEIFTMLDPLMTVTQSTVSMSIIVETGIYDGFAEAGVLLIPDANIDPNKDNLPPSSVRAQIQTSGKIRSGTHGTSVSGLQKETTYQVWSYYTLTKDEVPVYELETAKVTTASTLPISYYSFVNSRFDFAEMDFANSSGRQDTRLVTIRRDGDKGDGEQLPGAIIHATAEFYEADDEGHFIDGDPSTPEVDLVPVSIEGLDNSNSDARTLTFDVSDVDFLNTGNTTAQITIRLFDNFVAQGHTIARLRLSVEMSTARGSNYISEQNGYTDIYIQDDESPIKEYKMALMNNEEPGLEDLEARGVTTDTGAKMYRYEFSGIDVGETREDTLTIKYVNASSGYLDMIAVGIYKSPQIDPANISEDFAITDGPSMVFLPTTEESPLGFGTFNVTPSTNLEDGIHKAYVCLRTEDRKEDGSYRMKAEDYTWIEVIRVVGQSTLSGRIYFGHQFPRTSAMIPDGGKAKVMLYPRTARYTDAGELVSDDTNDLPMYEVETDTEKGGYFEIKHILNSGQKMYKWADEEKLITGYYIVVEKDGFLTYDPIYYDKFYTGTGKRNVIFINSPDSHKYEFNLGMMAGDLDGDREITMDKDYEIFLANFNKFYDLDAPTDEPKTNSLDTVRLCDFNFDGTVNVLDRLLMRNYISTNVFGYGYTTINNQGEMVSGGIPRDLGLA